MAEHRLFRVETKDGSFVAIDRWDIPPDKNPLDYEHQWLETALAAKLTNAEDIVVNLVVVDKIDKETLDRLLGRKLLYIVYDGKLFEHGEIAQDLAGGTTNGSSYEDEYLISEVLCKLRATATEAAIEAAIEAALNPPDDDGHQIATA